ncbi:MAG: hypothetical protein M1835_003567 [Candelina submexicana]|nr:MAG: hypothetical protein M1835_003567 [Candelina submexicana]
MTIQPEVWKTWMIDMREHYAQRVLSSTWDESLLSVTGLVKMDKVQIELFSFANRQKPASTIIIDLFEKEKEPCLRMSWTIVQCVGYNNELRDSLEKAHQAYEDYHRTPSAELSDSTNSEILQDQVDKTEGEETDRGEREEDHGESEGEESEDGANSKVHQPVKQSKRKPSRSCHKRRRREWTSGLSDMNSVSIDELEQDLIHNEQAEHLRYYSDDSGPYSYQASDSDQENAERPRKRPRRSQRLSENYRKGKAMRKRQVL